VTDTRPLNDLPLGLTPCCVRRAVPLDGNWTHPLRGRRVRQPGGSPSRLRLLGRRSADERGGSRPTTPAGLWLCWPCGAAARRSSSAQVPSVRAPRRHRPYVSASASHASRRRHVDRRAAGRGPRFRLPPTLRLARRKSAALRDEQHSALRIRPMLRVPRCDSSNSCPVVLFDHLRHAGDERCIPDEASVSVPAVASPTRLRVWGSPDRRNAVGPRRSISVFFGRKRSDGVHLVWRQ
jgi:hypothetical protein